MNRRFLTLTLAGVLCVTLLAGCGGGNAETPAPTPDASAPVTETPSVETPIPETEPPVETPDAGSEETPAPDPETPPAQESTPPAQSPSQQPVKPSPSPENSPAPEVTTKPSAPAEPQASVVQSVWKEISALELPSLTSLDDETLKALYGIDAADLEEYIAQIPLANVQATEFFIAKVKDGSMDTVKAAVQGRQKDLVDSWSQYLPAQLELVEDYQLVVNGSYIFFAVSYEADTAAGIFNSYTK